MSDGRILQGADGELLLCGVLDYQSGPALRQAGRELIRGSRCERLRLDCSGVEKSSSVGLSLLLAFTRGAKAEGREISIIGLPDDMRQIARVSELLDVLPVQAGT